MASSSNRNPLTRTLVALLAWLMIQAVQADTTRWEWVNPLPQGNPLNDVIWGDNQYVAVGEQGTILTSPDGIDWQPQNSGTTARLTAIAYNGAQYVVVGEQFFTGQGTILTSTDGMQWDKRSTGITGISGVSMSDIIWDGTRFIAVGWGGTEGKNLFTSADGAAWIAYKISATSDWWSGSTTGVNLYSVAKSNTRYVVTGGAGTILSSEDLTTWTLRTPATGFFDDLYEVVWNGSQFVAAGGVSNGYPTRTSVAVSADGIDWLTVTIAAEDPITGTSPLPLQALLWDGAQYIASGSEGKIFTSTNGTRWTPIHTSATGINAISLNSNNQYLAVGGSTTGGPSILTSTDRINWADRTTGSRMHLNALATGSNKLIAVGAQGTLLSSLDDGSTWLDNGPVGNAALHDVIWTGTAYFVAGNDGTLLTSADGNTWTTQDSKTQQHLYAIAWNGGSRYVAVGAQGTVISSADGSTWNLNQVGTQDILDVTWGNNTFVAVGSQGVIETSMDGINWTPCSSGTNNQLNGIVWANNQFMAVGAGSTVVTSTNGTDWHVRTIDTIQSTKLMAVIHTGTQYLIVGSNGTIIASADGASWETQLSTTLTDLRDILMDAASVIVAGDGGTILRGGEFPDLALSGSSAPAYATAGSDVTYTLKIANTPITDFAGVTLVDTLPANADFKSATPTQGSCGTPSNGKITCDLGLISKGGNATVVIVVTLKSTATGTAMNQARVFATTSEASRNNNDVFISTRIGNPDLAITTEVSASAITLGTPLTYSLTITNKSLFKATSVMLVNELPVNVNFLTYSSQQGSCLFDIQSRQLSCKLGDIAAGQKTDVVVSITPTALGTYLTNTTVSSSVADAQPADNQSSVTFEAGYPDIAVFGKALPNPVSAGSTLAYTVTVTNQSKFPASAVQLQISIPASATFRTSVATAGSCGNLGSSVSCNIGNLAGNAVVTVTVKVTPNTAGRVQNMASVTLAESDPNTLNNQMPIEVVVNSITPAAGSPAQGPGGSPGPTFGSGGGGGMMDLWYVFFLCFAFALHRMHLYNPKHGMIYSCTRR